MILKRTLEKLKMSQRNEIDVEEFTDTLLPENFQLEDLPDVLGDYSEVEIDLTTDDA